MKKSKGSLHLDSSLVLKFPSEDEEFLYFSLARRLKDPLAVSLKNFLRLSQVLHQFRKKGGLQNMHRGHVAS